MARGREREADGGWCGGMSGCERDREVRSRRGYEGEDKGEAHTSFDVTPEQACVHDQRAHGLEQSWRTHMDTHVLLLCTHQPHINAHI